MNLKEVAAAIDNTRKLLDVSRNIIDYHGAAGVPITPETLEGLLKLASAELESALANVQQ